MKDNILAHPDQALLSNFLNLANGAINVVNDMKGNLSNLKKTQVDALKSAINVLQTNYDNFLKGNGKHRIKKRRF